MMRQKNILFLLILVLCVTISFQTSAASKATKAKKAYRKAVLNGNIRTSSNMYCALKDANGDKIPELIIYGEFPDPTLYIYTYKTKKVKRIIRRYVEYEMFYNPYTKVFTEAGEGDGGWVINYQLKGGRLKEKNRYVAEWSQVSGGKLIYSKKTKTSKKQISRRTYVLKWKEAKKKSCLKKMSKSVLAKKLK